MRTNLQLENIHRLLKGKGAKNVISIADCCNFKTDSHSSIAVLGDNNNEKANINKLCINKNYQQLFSQQSLILKQVVV